MINIPTNVLARFESAMTKKSIPNALRNYYKKWLRYYLDSCQKYNQPISTKESLQQFINNEQGEVVEKYHFLRRRIELRITRRELA
jgi:hypothetical protein